MDLNFMVDLLLGSVCKYLMLKLFTEVFEAVDYWEKIEKLFSIFEFRLGINFSLFRLGHFEKVESRLGSPEAGVEIDTGWKRELFFTFWDKAEQCQTNTFWIMNFLIFFYFRTQMESKSKLEKQK